jgi:hypothetical protein
MGLDQQSRQPAVSTHLLSLFFFHPILSSTGRTWTRLQGYSPEKMTTGQGTDSVLIFDPSLWRQKNQRCARMSCDFKMSSNLAGPDSHDRLIFLGGWRWRWRRRTTLPRSCSRDSMALQRKRRNCFAVCRRVHGQSCGFRSRHPTRTCFTVPLRRLHPFPAGNRKPGTPSCQP